jgi:hypothetical protein
VVEQIYRRLTLAGETVSLVTAKNEENSCQICMDLAGVLVIYWNYSLSNRMDATLASAGKTGAKLINESLRWAKEMGYTSVVLVGNPAYYYRFGFKLSVEFGITQLHNNS